MVVRTACHVQVPCFHRELSSFDFPLYLGTSTLPTTESPLRWANNSLCIRY